MSDADPIGFSPAPARDMVTVRGALGDPAFAKALEDNGFSVPSGLKLTGGPDEAALWFSPDEVLVLTEAEKGPALAAALSDAFGEMHAMALDVSDARVVFRLTGARVGEVLAKGAPCDCSDKGFPPGTVRRTHLAGLAVAIWRFDAETWEIACFRSFGHHLEAWLQTVSAPAAAVNF
ncbi:MAG: sarcosine oxidase subunit gamma family protein [Pseudomonadota bacterium]